MFTSAYSLGCASEMNDNVEPMLSEKVAQQPLVPYVSFEEGEVGMGSNRGKIPSLQFRLVVGIKVVQADDRLLPFEQALGQMGPDKSRATGDQKNTHAKRHPADLENMTIYTNAPPNSKTFFPAPHTPKNLLIATHRLLKIEFFFNFSTSILPQSSPEFSILNQATHPIQQYIC